MKIQQARKTADVSISGSLQERERIVLTELQELCGKGTLRSTRLQHYHVDRRRGGACYA